MPVFNFAISRPPIKNLARKAKRMSWMYFVQYQSAIAALEVGVENGRHRHTRSFNSRGIDRPTARLSPRIASPAVLRM